MSSGLLLLMVTFMPNAMGATTPDGLCAALRAADLLRPGIDIDTCVAAAARRRLDEEAMDAVGSPRGLLDLALTATCIICAALAAGLTMGVVSLDPLDLRVKMRTGSKSEQACAARLLPLVDRRPHHQVLVTLLLLNSCANEALPLFLDKLVPSWAAIVISVTAVLVFGEIAPSALFTGPNKLQIAAAFAPLVHCFLVVLAPLAYPMALALDAALHEEAKASSRAEVLALVDVERELANEDGRAEPFTEDEADLVKGAMSLSTTSVREVMEPAPAPPAVISRFFVHSYGKRRAGSPSPASSSPPPRSSTSTTMGDMNVASRASSAKVSVVEKTRTALFAATAAATARISAIWSSASLTEISTRLPTEKRGSSGVLSAVAASTPSTTTTSWPAASCAATAS